MTPTHWVAWVQYGNLECYHFTNADDAHDWVQHLIQDPDLEIRAVWGMVSDNTEEAKQAILEDRD